MRHAVGRRQLSVGHAHAVALHAPPTGADEQGAGRPHHPHAERGALDHQPGPRDQRPRLVADEVAEQAQRALLGGVARTRSSSRGS